MKMQIEKPKLGLSLKSDKFQKFVNVALSQPKPAFITKPRKESYTKTKPKSPEPKQVQPKPPKLTIERYNEYRAILTQKFPTAFPEDDYLPLTRHAHKDVAKALNITDTIARAFLKRYTQKGRYLEKYRVGVWRVDINGNPTDQITEQLVEDKKKDIKPNKVKFLQK